MQMELSESFRGNYIRLENISIINCESALDTINLLSGRQRLSDSPGDSSSGQITTLSDTLEDIQMMFEPIESHPKRPTEFNIYGRFCGTLTIKKLNCDTQALRASSKTVVLHYFLKQSIGKIKEDIQILQKTSSIYG